MNRTRIILIEDAQGLLDGPVQYLADEPDKYAVVGTATSPDAAEELIADGEFDVAIVDLELVHGSSYPHGFELAHRIRQQHLEAKVILWSFYTTVEADLLRRAARPLERGLLFDAVVSKNQSLRDLVDAIDALRELPQIKLWIDDVLIPPPGYSAVLELTPAEDSWIRQFAQHPGARPADLMKGLGIKDSAFYTQRRQVIGKVVRELRIRDTQLLDRVASDHANLSDDDLVGRITDEVLFEWARKRCLHWPITHAELSDRRGARPNQPSPFLS